MKRVDRIFILLGVWFVGVAGFAAEYQGKDLSVWVPDGATTVRAVIVHRHYGAGNQLYGKEAWRSFAKEEKLAMALLVPSAGKRKKDPVHPKQGVHDVQRLYAGLAAAAEKLRIPQLAKAPFIPTGVSRGGANGIAMIYAAPERAVAAVGYHGESVIGSERFAGKGLDVPVLYALAANDPKRNGHVFAYLTKGMRNRFGAPWTIIVQPDCRHNSTGDDRYVLPWISTVLKLRIGENGGLVPVDWSTAGWGNAQLYGASGTASLRDPRIVEAPSPGEGRQVSQTTLVWLPSPKLAELWVDYHAPHTK